MLTQGHFVICVDNFYSSSKSNILHLLDNPHFEIVRHDVTFPLFLEVDSIYNLACPASPVHYQSDPVQTVKTSVHGAINMLGLAQKSADQTDSAIASYREAIEIKPDYADGHYSLGNALSSLNRFNEAIGSFQTPPSLRPDFTLAHFNKAAAQRSKGELAEARSSQQDSLLASAPALRSNRSLLELCRLLIDLEIVPALHDSQDGVDAVYENLLQTSAGIQDWDFIQELDAFL